MEYKIGDRIRRTEDAGDNDEFMAGDVHTITRVGVDYVYVEINGREIGNSKNNVELVKNGRGRPKVDNGIRFMAVEANCQNKSHLVRTEIELKEMMEGISSPDGEHIGYMLVPLFKAENKKVFTKIKVPKYKN